MTDRRGIIIMAALCMGCFILGVNLGRKSRLHAHEEGIKREVKEITVRDTVAVKSPVYVASRITSFALVPVHDTIRVRDTLYLAVPREVREYADSNYRAILSGIDPRLESLDIYMPKTLRTVTVRSPSSRWGFGICAGPTFMVDVRGEPRAGLGITAGLRYSF